MANSSNKNFQGKKKAPCTSCTRGGFGRGSTLIYRLYSFSRSRTHFPPPNIRPDFQPAIRALWGIGAEYSFRSTRFPICGILPLFPGLCQAFQEGWTICSQCFHAQINLHNFLVTPRKSFLYLLLILLLAKKFEYSRNTCWIPCLSSQYLRKPALFWSQRRCLFCRPCIY